MELKLLVMPDFCSTGLWIANEDLRDHECVDREELCSSGIMITEELYQECQEWNKDYDNSHNKEYNFKSIRDWERIYQNGIKIANKIKSQCKNIEVHFWLEGFSGDVFIKEEIV